MVLLARPRRRVPAPMRTSDTPLADAVAGTTALVLGGAGFVGSWLCERLLDAGARVHCVDSLLTGSRANVEHLRVRPGFTLAEADIAQWIPEPAQVHWVLHLASPAAPAHYLRWPEETLRAGSIGTMNALDVAERHGARFLLASTSEVYGDPLVHPQPEHYWGNVNPTGPRSVYDEAKRFAEAVLASRVRRGVVDAVTARLFNTYGPRMADGDGRLMPTLVRQALAERPLTVAGDGSRTRSLCWVDDTVDGLLRLLVSPLGGAVNIGNDHEVTLLEVARQVREHTHTSAPLVSVPVPEDDPSCRRPDLSRAREELGWSPQVSLDEGVRRFVQAERALRSQAAVS